MSSKRYQRSLHSDHYLTYLPFSILSVPTSTAMSLVFNARSRIVSRVSQMYGDLSRNNSKGYYCVVAAGPFSFGDWWKHAALTAKCHLKVYPDRPNRIHAVLVAPSSGIDIEWPLASYLLIHLYK